MTLFVIILVFLILVLTVIKSSLELRKYKKEHCTSSVRRDYYKEWYKSSEMTADRLGESLANYDDVIKAITLIKENVCDGRKLSLNLKGYNREFSFSIKDRLNEKAIKTAWINFCTEIIESLKVEKEECKKELLNKLSE